MSHYYEIFEKHPKLGEDNTFVLEFSVLLIAGTFNQHSGILDQSLIHNDQ